MFSEFKNVDAELRKEFGRNNAETMATMKLGGFMEVFKKNLKFHAEIG